MTGPAPDTDAALAARLAEEAGRILLAIRERPGLTPAERGVIGDREANAFLVDALRAARPDDGLLSEERKCDGTRLTHARVWIVDPVDGTREYGEGRSDWAVHVALAVDGVATLGAVALPALGLVLRSDQPTPLLPPASPPRMVVSRSRPPETALTVAAAIGAELVPMGSAGAKAMAVVRGEAEIYVHSGGQFEWDSCAPVAVAAAAGLHVSRIDGSPLVYNRADPYLPDLLICRPEWTARVLRETAE